MDLKNTNYVSSLQNKNPIQILQIVKKTFPSIKSKTPAMAFHESVKEIFKTKMSDEAGLKLLPKLYKIYTLLYPNLKTRKQRLSQIRMKFIKPNQSDKLYGLSMLDKYFNINRSERTGIIKEYQKDVATKNRNKMQIDIDFIFKKMDELIDSTDVYNKALALLLASGCRPIELFFMNKFQYEVNDGAWIKVLNLAKKREGQKDSTTRPIIYFTPIKFFKELKIVRKHFTGKKLKNANNELSKNVSAILNRRALLNFPFLKSVSQRSSMLRKIYAVTAYRLYGNPQKENQNSFIGRILGHSGLLTSFSYSWVSVTTKGNQSVKVAALKSKINKLESQTKTKRTASQSDKLKILQKIWRENNGKITNTKLREKSGMGSRIVNKFLQSKKI